MPLLILCHFALAGNGLKGGLNYAFSQLDPSKREFLWINRQKPLTTYQINFNGDFLQEQQFDFIANFTPKIIVTKHLDKML